MTESLQNLMNETSAWSDKTFDEGRFRRNRSVSISYHLQKEAKELTEALKEFYSGGMPTLEFIEDTNKEFADVLILLMDAACHYGLNADQLLTVAFNKLEENKSRTWGTPDENGVVEHIRD